MKVQINNEYDKLKTVVVSSAEYYDKVEDIKDNILNFVGGIK